MWNITRTFLVNWRFVTTTSWASKFASYMTRISYSMSFSPIQQMLLDWNCSSSFSLMIKFLSFFITFLQYWYSLKIASVNLEALFSPLKSTIGLVNSSSTQTSLQAKLQGMWFWYFMSKNLHNFQHSLNCTQNQHKF